VLFVLSVLLYALGASQIYLHGCRQTGPSIAMAAVGLGICGAALFATYAVVVRTAESWFTLAGVLLLLLAAYLAVGAMAPPGCSVA
jgi:membrane-bound metal-dependent hydrolase YbcI (DUF457 family)